MIEITLKRTLDDEFIGDVLVCAFDGGLGACWYWCEPDRSVDDTFLTTMEPNADGEFVWTACRIEHENVATGRDDLTRLDTIDAEVIRLGMQRILDDKDLIAPYIREYIVAAVSESDAGHVDAEAADCIVQIGLFGQLVYG